MAITKRGPGRPPLDIPTKQVGIRLPIPLWKRAVRAAKRAGQRPGAYVADLLRNALDQDHALEE